MTKSKKIFFIVSNVILIIMILIPLSACTPNTKTMSGSTDNQQKIEKLSDETVNGFTDNQEKFEIVKEFIISTIRSTPDENYFWLNLENDNYRNVTDDKEVIQALDVIARKLNYVEIYASVHDETANIRFIRQQGNKSRAEFSIIYDDYSEKENREMLLIDDDWYFYCWAGD